MSMGIFHHDEAKQGKGGHPNTRKDIEDIKNLVTTPHKVRENHLAEIQGHFGSNIQNLKIEPIEMEETDLGELDTSGAAPLFVKIDRYQGLLSTVGYMRNAMKVVDNSFVMLKEIDKVREQTLNVIRDTVNRVEERLSELDTELTTPHGHEISKHKPQAPQKTELQKTEEVEMTKDEARKVENVEGAVSDLKNQIKNLKDELKNI